MNKSEFRILKFGYVNSKNKGKFLSVVQYIDVLAGSGVKSDVFPQSFIFPSVFDRLLLYSKS